MIFARYIGIVTFALVTLFSGVARAQVENVDPSVSFNFQPRSGTFTVGTEFQLPVYMDTEGAEVKEVTLEILFDPDMVSVVRPSSGRSLFDSWVESPTYDNEKGIVRLKGGVGSGVTTESGLITSVTFISKATGDAVFTMSDASQVILSDALVTVAKPSRDRAVFQITPKAQEGVSVFSETHPSPNKWYNNTSPVFAWVGDPTVADYSYELDDKPSTIPDNGADTNETTISFENIDDGLWYFHIKARKKDAWYGTSHYLVKLDTKPPAPFTPTVESLSGREGRRAVLSFRTVDSLSGIDRYEVGVVDADRPTSEKPVFVQTESPYSLPDTASDKVRVIVRAYDRAGNVEEGAITIDRAFTAGFLISQYAMPLLATVVVVLILFVLFHFVVRHHSLRRVHRAMGSYDDESAQVIHDVPHRTLPQGRQFEGRILNPAPAQIEIRKIAAVSHEEVTQPTSPLKPVIEVPKMTVQSPPVPKPAPMTSFVHPPTPKVAVAVPPPPVKFPVQPSPIMAKPLPVVSVPDVVSEPVSVPHMVVTPEEYITYTPPPAPAAEILSTGEPIIEMVTSAPPVSVQPAQQSSDAAGYTGYTLVRPKNPPTKLSAMMVMPRAKPAPNLSTPPTYSPHTHFPDPVLPKHT